MPDLTIEQRTVLGQIADAKAARATVKARIEAENRARMEDAVRDAETLLNRKVREAHEIGVSKRRIAREGLGTVDPTIVNRILERTAGEAAVEAALATVAVPLPMRELPKRDAAERGHVDPDADLFVELAYPTFPTQWRGPAADYPKVLTGLLKRVFGLWYVVEDPSGFLEWELSDIEANEHVLQRLLTTYADKAATVR